MQSLTPEERKMATIVYTEISEHLTPDFSAEDWLNLHEKAIEGDLTLGKMWVSLWMRKVNLSPCLEILPKSMLGWAARASKVSTSSFSIAAYAR